LSAGHGSELEPRDTIPLGREKMLRVVDVRPASGDDGQGVLVVKEV
jgi:hypothetical protein